MNSLLISLCLMFSGLPYCNVEDLSNDEFAQSFGYQSFLQMETNEKKCVSISLKDIPKIKCDLTKDKISKNDLDNCNKSRKENMDIFNKNIQSKEFKNNDCTTWLIGWDESNISKEYIRRKSD